MEHAGHLIRINVARIGNRLLLLSHEFIDLGQTVACRRARLTTLVRYHLLIKIKARCVFRFDCLISMRGASPPEGNYLWL